MRNTEPRPDLGDVIVAALVLLVLFVFAVAIVRAVVHALI